MGRARRLEQECVGRVVAPLFDLCWGNGEGGWTVATPLTFDGAPAVARAEFVAGTGVLDSVFVRSLAGEPLASWRMRCSRCRAEGRARPLPCGHVLPLSGAGRALNARSARKTVPVLKKRAAPEDWDSPQNLKRRREEERERGRDCAAANESEPRDGGRDRWGGGGGTDKRECAWRGARSDIWPGNNAASECGARDAIPHLQTSDTMAKNEHWALGGHCFPPPDSDIRLAASGKSDDTESVAGARAWADAMDVENWEDSNAVPGARPSLAPPRKARALGYGPRVLR